MNVITLAPPRYHLRRIVGYLPETKAQTLLRRLNILLGRYTILDVDHPLLVARDNLAYALAHGDGVPAAAGQAATAIVRAVGEGRHG